MSNIFLIADTHFGHENLLNKQSKDTGDRVRPFANVEEMDEHIIKQWNSVVGEKDKVYHLGDVTMKRKNLKIMERLNGDKVLIKGNHDIFKIKDYLSYFRDIRATHVLENFVLSHVPLHTSCLKRWMGGNIHGHLHDETLNDHRYFCVSVEQINYTPIEFGQLREMWKRSIEANSQKSVIARIMREKGIIWNMGSI